MHGRANKLIGFRITAIVIPDLIRTWTSIISSTFFWNVDIHEYPTTIFWIVWTLYWYLVERVTTFERLWNSNLMDVRLFMIPCVKSVLNANYLSFHFPINREMKDGTGSFTKRFRCLVVSIEKYYFRLSLPRLAPISQGASAAGTQHRALRWSRTSDFY